MARFVSALPGPTELEAIRLLTAEPVITSIYRLWDVNGACLYVGQTTVHPLVRILGHRIQPWWADVARADYIPFPADRPYRAEFLDLFEQQQIWDLKPLHNHPRTAKNWLEDRR
jgi:hypothetical protein